MKTYTDFPVADLPDKVTNWESVPKKWKKIILSCDYYRIVYKLGLNVYKNNEHVFCISANCISDQEIVFKKGVKAERILFNCSPV